MHTVHLADNHILGWIPKLRPAVPARRGVFLAFSWVPVVETAFGPLSDFRVSSVAKEMPLWASLWFGLPAPSPG